MAEEGKDKLPPYEYDTSDKGFTIRFFPDPRDTRFPQARVVRHPLARIVNAWRRFQFVFYVLGLQRHAAYLSGGRITEWWDARRAGSGEVHVRVARFPALSPAEHRWRAEIREQMKASPPVSLGE